WVYGLPVFGEPGVKLAFHGGGPAIDPAAPTPPPAAERLAALQAYVAERLPGLDGAILSSVSCRYTATPDGDFVLDELPQAPGVIIASPCSGHGFKFAILMGAILAELAATGATRYAIDLFRARRLLAG
ncbi:MAG TPA: FAD-dependent oxidoreductase, partial [Herpetosiphonaceae bacterium]